MCSFVSQWKQREKHRARRADHFCPVNALRSVLHCGNKKCSDFRLQMTTAWTWQKPCDQRSWSFDCKFLQLLFTNFIHHLHCGMLDCQPIIRVFLFDPHECDQRHDWNRNQLCLDLCKQWTYTKLMWHESHCLYHANTWFQIMIVWYGSWRHDYVNVIKEYFYNNGNTAMFIWDLW